MTGVVSSESPAHMNPRLARFVLVAALCVAPALANAQQPAAPAPAPGPGGPRAPTLPETISRDDQGRATVRAVRVTTPMRVDGKLDEAI